MSSASTTTAIVFREVGKPVKLEEIKISELQPNEALVEIHATGVCHTDLSCIDGTLPAAVPNVLGHEGAGVVVKVGSSVTNAAPGDKVLLSYNFCKTCETCKSGHPAYCDTWTPLNFGGARSDGTKSLADSSGADIHCNFFGQSSFGRHAVVSASSMVKVSADTDLKLYAPLGCGLQTGAGAVINSLRTRKGSSLAVWGVGPVGLAAVMAGKIVGASKIIAIDLQPDRLKLAQELGATDIVDGKAEDVAAQIQKLSGKNGVDFAVDCTGVPKVVENMVNSLGTRGRGCTVGAPSPGKTASIDIFSQLLFGREYIGCVEGDANPPETIPYLIEQHKAGNFAIEKMIKYYDAKDFQTAFDDMKVAKTIKPVLVWSN